MIGILYVSAGVALCGASGGASDIEVKFSGAEAGALLSAAQTEAKTWLVKHPKAVRDSKLTVTLSFGGGLPTVASIPELAWKRGVYVDAKVESDGTSTFQTTLTYGDGRWMRGVRTKTYVSPETVVGSYVRKTLDRYASQATKK